MKKFVIMLMLCLFLTGCGNSAQEEKTDAAAQDNEVKREETVEETGKEEADGKTEDTEAEEKENGKEKKEESEKETDPMEEKEDWETLATESYEYDDGSAMTLLFSLDRNGGTHFTIGLEMEEKWKAAYVYAALEETIQMEAMQGLNSEIVMTCGSDMITSYGFSYDLSNSDEQLVDSAEWLAEGLDDEELNSGEADALVGEIMADLIDFMSNI
ncbi:hypothetical protein AALA90_05025 [Lachnospiraceae bacterium 38-10]